MGGAFDFVSCCPPYQAVAYPALMAQLARSPLLHAGSWLVVEYPFEDRASLPDRLDGAGRSLAKLVDRRFGRTYVALYGPAAAGGGEAHVRGGGSLIDGVRTEGRGPSGAGKGRLPRGRGRAAEFGQDTGHAPARSLHTR